MTIEKYISKLETLLGEKLAHSEEQLGDSIVIYVFRQNGPMVAVVKESIDKLDEYSFKSLEHFKDMVKLLT